MNNIANLIKASVLASALSISSITASAQESLNIGFITTQSGPAGSLGIEMLNAYKLALKHTNGKLGGVPANLIIGDDQAKPQEAVQLARKMMQRDNVDIFTGVLFSHVIAAVSAVVIPKDKILLIPVGGSSNMAGKDCNANMFVVGWNTDTMFEAIGKTLSGVDKVAVIATNYKAGWDTVEGLKRTYGKGLSAEILVKLGQSDFGAEISQIRASGATALTIFLPGGSGIAFMRQFKQSGLGKTVKVYAATFQADETTFVALGDAAIGMMNTGNWNADLDNAANKKFVDGFRKEYGRTPSILAAMSYDAVMMLNAALSTTNGDASNKPALRAALENVSFDSVRGKIRFGANHLPIQNFYLSEVKVNKDGKLHNALVSTVFEDRADAHANACKLGR